MSRPHETQPLIPVIDDSVFNLITACHHAALALSRHPGKDLGIRHCISRCRLSVKTTPAGDKQIVCTDCTGSILAKNVRLPLV